MPIKLSTVLLASRTVPNRVRLLNSSKICAVNSITMAIRPHRMKCGKLKAIMIDMMNTLITNVLVKIRRMIRGLFGRNLASHPATQTKIHSSKIFLMAAP